MAAQLIATNGWLTRSTELVDRLRHQLLAGARLAPDQHRRAGRRGLLDRPIELADGRRVADDPAEAALVAQLAPQHADLATRRLPLDGLGQQDLQPMRIDGLGQVVVGAVTDRLDGRLHGALRGEDHDAEIGQLILKGAQQAEAVHARHHQVGQHDAGAERRDLLEGLLAVRGVLGHVAPRPNQLGEADARGAVVLDHEHPLAAGLVLQRIRIDERIRSHWAHDNLSKMQRWHHGALPQRNIYMVSAPDALDTPSQPLESPAPDMPRVSRALSILEVLLCSGFPTQLLIGGLLIGLGVRVTSPMPCPSASSSRSRCWTRWRSSLLVVLFLRLRGEDASRVLLGRGRFWREVRRGVAYLPLVFGAGDRPRQRRAVVRPVDAQRAGESAAGDADLAVARRHLRGGRRARRRRARGSATRPSSCTGSTGTSAARASAWRCSASPSVSAT